jgi:predicted PolB exonuclease-like 3'-5' exonuclease
MTPTLVFDLETIPDIEGLRRLNGWSDDVPDSETLTKIEKETNDPTS